MSLDQEVAFSFQQVTVGGTAVGLVSNNGVTCGFRALITCETNQVRFRYDGGAPTSSAGHLLNVGDILVIEGRYNVANFQAIATGANGTLMVTLETM